MSNKAKYPILEFDPVTRAVINPSEVYKPVDVSECCVICFFKDMVDRMATDHKARIVFTEKGVHGATHIYEFEHKGRPVAFLYPLIGAPFAAAFLEVAIAVGCRKFIVSGGAGVLDRDIPVGDIIVPTSAIRDEGVSYHYLPPGREVATNPKAVDTVVSTLNEYKRSYRLGKTWTTDAIFRETESKIKRRKDEGCLTVEMEAAALLAVAQFRGVDLGYILFGGDDVSGEAWDQRLGEPRTPIAEKLFWLSVEACLRL